MKNKSHLGSLILLLLFIISCSPVGDKSQLLFQENGTDWFSEGDADWTFINGELSGSLESGAGFVMTKESYKDFVLELEFKPDSTINSGIFIRCKKKELSFEDCYEVNIWDLHPKQKNRTGAIVERATPLKKVETLNQWNTYKIRNEKEHLQVWVNDILTVDINDKDLMEGPIALQAAESGTIVFRNIKLTNLE